MYTVYMRCYEDFLIFKLPVYNEEIRELLDRLDGGYRQVWWVTKDAIDILVPEYGYDSFVTWLTDKYNEVEWNDGFTKEELDYLSKTMNVS